MGGLGQGHLPFFFSKNHRLAREAGNAGGQKGRRSAMRKSQAFFTDSTRPAIFGFALQHHPNDID
jgi:hypothetical protein